MAVIHRIYAEKMGATSVSSFIGNVGDIFYDPYTLALRISDGTTPGGRLLAGGAQTGPDAADITFAPIGDITSATVAAAIAELDAEKMALTGGTLTGPLILSSALPTNPNEAISKSYLESYVNTITTTGLTSNNITFDNTTTTLTANTVEAAIIELDATKLGTDGGSVTGEIFSSVTTFTSNSSLVTKQYVDTLLAAQDTYIDTLAFDPATGVFTTVDTQGGVLTASFDGRYLPLSGGTMTGELILSNTATTSPNAAATVTYVSNYVSDAFANGSIASNTIVFDNSTTTLTATTVEAAIAELDAEKVAKAGDVMTGFLTLNANPTANLHAATKEYVDSGIASAVTSGVTANNITYNNTTSNTGLSATTVNEAITELALEKLDKAGGTMTGTLVLAADPVNALEAATKQYVDSYVMTSIADVVNAAPTALDTLVELANALGDDPDFANTVITQLGDKVNRSGDTLTGFLTLHADPTFSGHAATKNYVDGKVAAVVAGGVTSNNITYAPSGGISSNTVSGALAELDAEKVARAGDTMLGMLTLFADPTANLHAVTKQYVDSKVTSTTISSNNITYVPAGTLSSNTVTGALAELDAEKVAKAGDTMTGLLVLSADPVAALGAATKQYVDSKVSTTTISSNNITYVPGGTLTSNTVTGALAELDAEKVAKAGDTMTGFLTLSADPTATLHAATKGYVDTAISTVVSGGVTANNITYTPTGNVSATTISGAIAELDSEKVAKAGDTMTGALILSGDPTANLQAATKAYVDSKVSTTTISSNNITYTPTGNITANTVTAALAELDAEKVAKAGDVMTGFLTLSADPTANLHAVTKQYVDGKVTSTVITSNNVSYTPSGNITANTVTAALAELDAEKVAKAGDTMTGLLVLSADPSAALGAATKQYVDNKVANVVNAAPAALDTLNELAAALGNDASFSTTVTNNIAGKVAKAGDTMTGFLTLSAAPTATLHAATKGYVDTAIAGVVSGGVNASSIAFTPSGNISANTLSGAVAELDSEKVAKAGDTMTGLLTLSADPTANLHAATKQYVDSKVTTTVISANNIAYTPSGNIAANTVTAAIAELDSEKVAKAGDTMTGLLTLSGAPTANLHAATKAYVDSKTYAINDLTDVDTATTAPTNNQVLSWDGTNFVPKTISAGTSLPNGTAFGQNVTWNGSSWDAQVPRAAVLFGSSSAGSAETGINNLMGGGTNSLAGALYYDSTLGAVRYYSGVTSSWRTVGTGDVYNSNTVANNTLAFFNDTTGKQITQTTGIQYSSTGRALAASTGYYFNYSQAVVNSSQFAGISTSSTTLSWDYAYQKRTATSALSFTFGAPTRGMSSGEAWSMTVELYMNGGSVTWPAAVKWSNGTAPTLTNLKTHLIMFVTSDGGSTIYGSSLTNY